MYCWVNAEHVGLVVQERRAEGRAEIEQKNESGHQPHRAFRQTRAQRRPGFQELRALGAGVFLAHEEHRHQQHDKREDRGNGEGGVQVAVLGEVPAQQAHQDRGASDRGPLHGLKGAGEPARLAVLHHQRVGQDVVEGQAETHRRIEAGKPPVGVVRRQPGNQTGCAGQRRGQQEIALAPPTEQRQEIRDQSVQRLDEPRDRRQEKEVRHQVGRQALVLEPDGDRLLGQPVHPLREVDHGEQDREAPGFGGLERVQAPQPVVHVDGRLTTQVRSSECGAWRGTPPRIWHLAGACRHLAGARNDSARSRRLAIMRSRHATWNGSAERCVLRLLLARTR